MLSLCLRSPDRPLSRHLAFVLLLWPMALQAAQAELPTAALAQKPTPAAMQGYLANAYHQVLQDARTLADTTDRDCPSAAERDGGTAARTRLKTGFEKLAISWSRVGFIRIGPYRDDHAGQRLLFWPDKRGSGERQIQQALMTQPETLLKPESLRAQSVALQGLPAFEAVMTQFAQPPIELAAGRPGFSCAYLATLADGMADNSQQLAARMAEGSDAFRAISFAQWMEVIRGGLQITGEIKLQSIGQSLQNLLEKARNSGVPVMIDLTRKVPFSRSGLALASVSAELDGIADLLDSAEIEDLLQPSDAGYLASVHFQIAQAAKAVESLRSVEGETLSVAALEDAIGVVDYASGMLAQSGMDMLTTLYPALGLSRGFNSMDGD